MDKMKGRNEPILSRVNEEYRLEEEEEEEEEEDLNTPV
jgi:hypothetical protein